MVFASSSSHCNGTIGVAPVNHADAMTLPYGSGRDRVKRNLLDGARTAPLPDAGRTLMSKPSFRSLQNSIQQLLERIETCDDTELERPVCPAGNPKCDGYGNVYEADGMRTCECVQRVLQRVEVQHADVPRRFVKESLNTFEKRSSFARAALTYANDYVANFDPEAGQGLYIHGTTGSGKTHLAVGILKTLIANHYSGVFFNVTSLFDQIRRNMDPAAPSGAAEALEARLQSSIVVLDDLGVQRTSAWVVDRLYAMINAIYEDCRTLIITSTLKPSELEQTYDRSIVSRIIGMCKVVELEGADQRRPKTGRDSRGSKSAPKKSGPIHSVADAFRSPESK